LGAFSIGSAADLFVCGWINSSLVYVLPFSMFVFPAFLEEAFFRGVLIPRNILDKGRYHAGIVVIISSLAFTTWHPLNALTINPGATIFLDSWFLLIVFLLGVVCSLGYIVSRSLWVPVIMHWLVIMVWVFFLGGRNLVNGG
jgi:predicted Abi (CAAX) family protease